MHKTPARTIDQNHRQAHVTIQSHVTEHHVREHCATNLELRCTNMTKINNPYLNILVGPVVRICRSHRQGPGSIPGLGISFAFRPIFCSRDIFRTCGNNFIIPRRPEGTYTYCKKDGDANALLVSARSVKSDNDSRCPRHVEFVSLNLKRT